MQLGAGSKDTWVFDGVTASPAPPSPARQFLKSKLGRPNLPSRVADNLFWLGRYSERLENGVRLVRTLLPALSGEEDFGRCASLETVIRLLDGLHYLPKEFPVNSIAEQRWRLERLLSDLVYDPTRTFGLGWNLKQLRRVAWHIKERLSADTWRVLQQLDADFSRPRPSNPDHRLAAQMALLDSIIVTLSAFAGLLMENMTRNHGWRFLDIGRRLERGLQLVELLRSGLAEAPEDLDAYLPMLLQIADSSITYRTRYLTIPRLDLVIELLLTDELNPRSAGFQLLTLSEHVARLPEHEEDGRHSLEEQLVLKALTGLRLVNKSEMAARDAAGDLGALQDILRDLRANLYDLSDALTAQYLSHTMTARLTSSS
jgi:uncharacterized alpha-E superfamily protein